jgi:hypothetical protein
MHANGSTNAKVAELSSNQQVLIVVYFARSVLFLVRLFRKTVVAANKVMDFLYLFGVFLR